MGVDVQKGRNVRVYDVTAGLFLSSTSGPNNEHSNDEQGGLLFHLQLLIQQIQSPFISCRTSDDCKHSFTTFVVRTLCDGDFASAFCADFRDFGTSATNDTAYHIRRDRDILSANLRRIDRFRVGGSRLTIGEIGTIASTEGISSLLPIFGGGSTEGSIVGRGTSCG